MKNVTADSFVNPYNFVRVSFKDKKKKETKPEDKLHTGVLECRLITKTPLAIPDPEKKDEEKVDNSDGNEPGKHNIYPFFRYRDGIPVIPGSSLRGVIRSVYETATDSCFSTAKEDSIIGKRGKGSCRLRSDLCKACALFGFASGEKAGSKIRITDARAADYKKEQIEEKVTLRELASPKESYLLFYTRSKQEGKMPDYDHGAEPRGRKYYWHSESEYYKVIEDNGEKKVLGEMKNGKTIRNATMDLIKPNVTFKFRIYYDGITDTQLEELLWVLTFGENKDDSRLCHKLGHGKPLGLGSVKIVVDGKAERSFPNDYSIAYEKVEGIKNPFNEKDAQYKDLMKIVNMDTVKEFAVEYPRVVPSPEYSKILKENNRSTFGENEFASHQWFRKNKKPLPEIADDELTMPSLVIEKP